PVAAAPSRDPADHPAGHRGHVAPRVRIHGQGVRPRDRPDRRGPCQRNSTDNDMVLQPLVPDLLLRRGRGTQQRAARAGADLRPGVPVAQPGLVEAQSGGRHVSRLEKSRALRWLTTVAAIAALLVILFPVYAIVVGSFESTETLFSGTFYWLPHAATLDNYRTVLGAASANTQETVTGSQAGNVLTSFIVGLGTVLLALVVAVPAAYALSKYRLRVTVVLVSALLVAQIVP